MDRAQGPPPGRWPRELREDRQSRIYIAEKAENARNLKIMSPTADIRGLSNPGRERDDERDDSATIARR